MSIAVRFSNQDVLSLECARDILKVRGEENANFAPDSRAAFLSSLENVEYEPVGTLTELLVQLNCPLENWPGVER